MSRKLYIYKERAKVLMMTALLLAGCTADDETAVQQEDTLQLAAYTRNYVDLTRGVPDGYETFVPDDVTSIGIFLTPPDDDKPLSLGYFSYNGHYWRSNISVKSHDYYIYGFMPGDVISKSACSVSMLEGKTSFEDGAILTLDGLKPISKSDVCVVVGVQAVTSSSPDVKLGQFKYEYLGQAKGEHFVNLLMDHIYSCLQFRMSVDEDYAKVRTIKLKRMELKTAAVSGTKAVITLIANTSGNNPISKISWTTPAGGTGMSILLFEDEEGKALSATESLVLSGNLIPGCSDELSLVCQYDVYDRKGNLVRKDCEATNKLPSSLALSSLKAGERQPINLTVAPTFLGVLSDPDLDNPNIMF